MTTKTPPTGTHPPAPDPYAATWTEAGTTLTTLMAMIEKVVEDIGRARQGLHWQGGSEQYFQWQVARRVAYLGQNNDYLATLRRLVAQAEQIGSTVAAPQGGAA